MTVPNVAKSRMIFKVLVIGNDLPLQTGFLSRASGDRFSYQLYSTIGLSLGVVRFDYPDNSSIVLQLWSIPFSERLERLSRNFTRGHSAIILILRPHELENIPEMFERLSLKTKTPLMIVVVGSVRDAEAGSFLLDAFLGTQLPVQAVQSIHDIMSSVAEGLLRQKSANQTLPKIVALDEEGCPLYEPTLPEPAAPLNSDDEINEIRTIAIDLGLRVINDSCAVELAEGVAWVSMKTGTIRLEPGICRFCAHSCKRYANICIVSTDTGWSTLNLGSRALLTVAKIYALSARVLPLHVKNQIERTTICTRFDPNPVIPIEEIPDEILSGFKDSDSRKTLLEAARERAKEGRLSEDAYSILKKKLDKLESSRKL